jgi:uncharacterized cupin superfamily protein
MTAAPITYDGGSGPFTLGRATVLHLAADLTMCPLHLDESVWGHLNEVAEFADGRVLSIFDYSDSWTWWERHPVGEELVHLLSGEVAFRLDDGKEQAAVLRAGESLLVPQGAWHTAEILHPASMLFVTPTPAMTEHRDVEN